MDNFRNIGANILLFPSSGKTWRKCGKVAGEQAIPVPRVLVHQAPTSLILPDNVEKDKISANVVNEELTVELPKYTPEEKAKVNRVIEIH